MSTFAWQLLVALVGLALVGVGLWFVYWPLALIWAGLWLTLGSMIVDPDRFRKTQAPRR
jgi:hypothetical protein